MGLLLVMRVKLRAEVDIVNLFPSREHPSRPLWSEGTAGELRCGAGSGEP